MDKLEIELGHDEKEDSFYHAWGFRTDEKYYFFYDVSNNCRKFWIKLINFPQKDKIIKYTIWQIKDGTDFAIYKQQYSLLLKLYLNEIDSKPVLPY